MFTFIKTFPAYEANKGAAQLLPLCWLDDFIINSSTAFPAHKKAALHQAEPPSAAVLAAIFLPSELLDELGYDLGEPVHRLLEAGQEVERHDDRKADGRNSGEDRLFHAHPPLLDQELVVHLADGCFLERDWQCAVKRQGLFLDDHFCPCFDSRLCEIFLRVGKRDRLRLCGIKRKRDFKCAFHAAYLPSFFAAIFAGSGAAFLSRLVGRKRRRIRALDVANLMRLHRGKALTDCVKILIREFRIHGVKRAGRVLDKTSVRRAVLNLDFECRRRIDAMCCHRTFSFHKA
jgi:hypothetical protein